MIQLITPDPHIPCAPGWCLQYVRQAFGLPARHPTATAAWEASTSQHRDYLFPAGVWFPVWFALSNEPAGHVALVAPDGSVYSTSDLGAVPHHHPDLSDLLTYYARYGMTLTYRGWTEDVAGYPVITGAGIAAMGGTITELQEEIIVPNQADEVFYHLDGGPQISLNAFLNDIIRECRSARAANQALLAVQLEDPTDPGKTYSVADWIVWSATNAKLSAGSAAAAAGNTDPAALSAAISTAALAASAADVAARLEITLKEAPRG